MQKWKPKSDDTVYPIWQPSVVRSNPSYLQLSMWAKQLSEDVFVMSSNCTFTVPPKNTLFCLLEAFWQTRILWKNIDIGQVPIRGIRLCSLMKRQSANAALMSPSSGVHKISAIQRSLYIIPKVKHAPSVMVWDCISSASPCSFVVYVQGNNN